MPQFSHAKTASAFLLAFFCVFLFVSNASAQGDEARMKELVAQGATAFSEKRYADAAQLFEEAHEAKPNPTLLKNAMVAWYKGNQCDKALQVGAQYYREARDAGQLEAKDQSEIQTVISCGLNLAKQRIDESEFTVAEDMLFTATSAGPTDEQTERIAKLREDLRAKRDADTGGGDTGGGDVGGGEEPSDGAFGGLSTLELTGWGFTAVGVVGLIGSVVYALTAAGDERSAVSDCEDRITSTSNQDYYACLDQQLGTQIATQSPTEQRTLYRTEVQDPIESAQTTSIILYSVSGVVTAIGVGILVYHYFFTEADAQSAPEVMLTPTIGEDNVGAQLLWRF